MESRGPGDSKNVKTSQAYFFEGFISFFEDFSLTNCLNGNLRLLFWTIVITTNKLMHGSQAPDL